MSTPEERKRELERKKQRLAEMREKKRQMEDEKRKKLLEHQANPEAAPAVAPSQLEVDKILSDVGIDPDNKGPRLSDHGGSPAKASSIERDRSPARFYSSGGVKALSKAETTQVNFPPKEHIAYVKGTQTDGEQGGREFHVGSLDFWEDDALGGQRHQSAMGSQDTGSEVFALDESPTHQLAGILPHIGLVKPTDVQVAQNEPSKPKEVTPLTEEEKATITSAEPFIDFFDRATRIVERALYEEVDIFVDYSKDESDNKIADAGTRISLNRCFVDEMTRGRVVSCLDYSPQHPELIVASYNDNPNAPTQPDGIVAVWNTKFKKDSPELVESARLNLHESYIFHSQSRVTCVSFGKFHPNLILGGTYSGQICLWDNRQHKKTPVQKSPLSTSAHTHPVFSMAVVGTQNAHNLLTVSTDGRMCAWSLDMLAQPQDTIDLQRQNKQVGVTCLSFPIHDVNNFLVGSDEGAAYTGCRHGTKAGIVDAYEGHFAPLTGVSCHAAAGPVDFSQLFLTSSFDWTVKLWSTKEARPLYSFEGHNDYVTDVSWSPVHPALFACVDGRGKLQLWNINKDSESPIAQLVTETEPVAFNKVLWMPTGTQLAVGDYGGNVWLYDIHESVALPRPDEWARLSRTLADIKQAQIEQEELATAMAN